VSAMYVVCGPKKGNDFPSYLVYGFCP